MAVSITGTSKAFTGTGVPSIYAPEFYANSSAQVRVYVNGALQVIGDNYVVGNVGASAGVNVTGNFALGSQVLIERATPVTQLVDTQNNETILEDVIDAGFDKLTMIAQEQSGTLARALLVPKGETSVVLPAAAGRAGMFLAFDVYGNPIASPTTGGGDATLRNQLAALGGATLVGYRLSTLAALRSVYDRLADTVSLLDYRMILDADQNDVGLWLNRAWSDGKRAFHLPYNAAGYNWTTAHDPAGFSIWFDGCGNTVTLTGGGISHLKNTGIKSRVQNLTIIGNRATNQIFYEGMGPASVTENIQIERVDIGIKMTGGFEPVFDNIYGRNCKTALFHFADGVGPILQHFTYDTDGPWYYGKKASITRSGTTATVTTTVPHGFVTGQNTNIMGATQAAYNGNFVITVTGPSTFTYVVAGSPATPATAIAGGSGLIYASPVASIFAMPTKGAVWLQTEGAVIAGGDSIHGGLVIEVGTRNIEWALIGAVYFDSGLDNPGVQIINNSATYYVRGIFFLGTWSATNTRGFHITGSCTRDKIDGIYIEQCRIHNNTSEGIQVDNGQSIFIDGNNIIGNNAAVFDGSTYVKPGNSNQVLIGASTFNVLIARNKLFGAAMRWNTTPYEQIYITAGADGRAYQNDCGPTSNGFRIFNAAGATFIVGYNPGVTLPNFANDAAASAGGVGIKGWYRNGSVLMERQV